MGRDCYKAQGKVAIPAHRQEARRIFLAKSRSYWQLPTHGMAGHGNVRLVLDDRRTVTRCCPSAQIKGVPVMKTIISALIALAVLSGVTATANAFDAKSFYEELDRTRT